MDKEEAKQKETPCHFCWERNYCAEERLPVAFLKE